MSKPEIIKLSAAEKADMRRYLPETFGAKLRRLARQSLNDNPDTRLPWTEVAAWTPSTAYTYGQVIRNNGQRYVCLTAGTSAASGGPSTVNTGAASGDGTAAWSWVGPVELAANDPNAPVVTSSTALPGASGLNNYWYPVAYPDVFDLRGGIATVSGSYWTVNVGTSKLDGTKLGGQGASVVFETDELKFAIGTATGSASQVGFIVDGRWLSVSQTPNAAATTWHTFDFTGNGRRRMRRIEVVSYRVNFTFVGVATRPNGTIWKPALTDKIVAVFDGNSLFQGVPGPGPAVAGNTVPHRVGRKLGWSHVWNFGIGSTGYLGKGPGGDLFTFAERLPQIFAQHPDVIVVGDAVNDLIGNRTKAQIKAAVLAYIAEARSYDQHVPLILQGCWSYNAPVYTSTVADAEAAVLEAVQEAGDDRVFCVPIFNQGSLPLVHGAWNNSYKPDADNSSIMIGADSLHPPDVGVMVYSDYLAHYVATNVLPAL